MGGCIIKAKKIYLQLENNIFVAKEQKIELKDIAKVYSDDKQIVKDVEKIKIFKSYKNETDSIILAIDLINKINEYINDADVIIIGSTEVLLKYKEVKKQNKVLMFLKIFSISIILCLGASLAIINFHEDANMDASFKSIYFLITGKYEKKPLIMHIPYSLGLCSGVFVFFNHVWSKKNKQRKEPSPLDIEIHTYQEDINKYTIDCLKKNKKVGRTK
ncbi:stage V sporulation protein AA [Clostridiaceae bacterium M8S5]|nr:stage V sporulation protein AA [Clostridiaceae bacterium M8S5]